MLERVFLEVVGRRGPRSRLVNCRRGVASRVRLGHHHAGVGDVVQAVSPLNGTTVSPTVELKHDGAATEELIKIGLEAHQLDEAGGLAGDFGAVKRDDIVVIDAAGAGCAGRA